MLDYLLLFASAFLAATVLPFYSEVTLFLLLERGEDPLVLLTIATIGNTLGAVVNWALGRYLLHYQDRRWFYFSRDQIARAQRWFQRRGVWSLLLAWMPLGGDALTLIAGIMRVPLPLFILLVGAGKGLRYLAVIWLAHSAQI
jgi:membrane protein YqaA with SNARE-associated domain